MIGDIASVATAVGVLLAAVGLFAQVRQRKFALEQMYIERYWAIDDDWTLSRHSGSPDTAHRERYWRLCEDEFEIARLGWIGARVWDVWHDGIVTAINANRPAFGTYHLLDTCMTQAEHRARECPALAGAGRRRRASWLVERVLG